MIEMDQLQCPFTWRSRLLPDLERIHREDKLPLAPSLWSNVVLKLSLAFTEHRAGNYDKARALITECYMPILHLGRCGGLPVLDAFDSGCDLVNQYGEALKHVLDSTWAFMQLRVCGDGEDDGATRDLKQFVKRIVPYDDLDKEQQAAVLAIQANLSKSPKNLKLIRRAIKMNPLEGQWHCNLGKLLLMSRIPKTANYPGRPPSQEEVKALGEAYRLRKDPESCTLLSESWLDNGPNGHTMAAAIVKDALEKFPDSASVQARAARVLWLLPAPQLDLGQVENCYRRALELAGECLFLRFKLGGLCVILDKLFEAQFHYERAAAIYPEAQEVLDSLNRLPALKQRKPGPGGAPGPGAVAGGKPADCGGKCKCCQLTQPQGEGEGLHGPQRQAASSPSPSASPSARSSSSSCSSGGATVRVTQTVSTSILTNSTKMQPMNSVPDMTVSAPSIVVERKTLAVNSVTTVTALRRTGPNLPPPPPPLSVSDGELSDAKPKKKREKKIL